MLTGQGWVADNRYAADEPEGKVSGFRKDDGLAVLEVKSALAKSVSCPDNVAIATCYEQAKPEQILYRITLKAARQDESVVGNAQVRVDVRITAAHLSFRTGRATFAASGS